MENGKTFPQKASPVSFLTTTLALLLGLTSVADSLRCFQCGTTSTSHECIDDWSGFVNTSLGLTDKYAKNCTDTNANWTRCMIQTSEGSGRQTLFHRGCHDGQTFSKLYDHPRFKNLPPNNLSTCATIVESREFVCFRFCDTDFCNGPQPPVKVVDPCSGDSSSINLNGTTCGAVGVHGAITLTEMIVCAAAMLFGLYLT